MLTNISSRISLWYFPSSSVWLSFFLFSRHFNSVSVNVQQKQHFFITSSRHVSATTNYGVMRCRRAMCSVRRTVRVYMALDVYIRLKWTVGNSARERATRFQNSELYCYTADWNHWFDSSVKASQYVNDALLSTSCGLWLSADGKHAKVLKGGMTCPIHVSPRTFHPGCLYLNVKPR